MIHIWNVTITATIRNNLDGEEITFCSLTAAAIAASFSSSQCITAQHTYQIKDAFDIINNNNINRATTHTKILTDTNMASYAKYGNQRLINSIIVTNQQHSFPYISYALSSNRLEDQRIFNMFEYSFLSYIYVPISYLN